MIFEVGYPINCLFATKPYFLLNVVDGDFMPIPESKLFLGEKDFNPDVLELELELAALLFSDAKLFCTGKELNSPEFVADVEVE